MKVRELIEALRDHDPDMDVVMPSHEHDYCPVGRVFIDRFMESNGTLQLTDERDPTGMFSAIRLMAASEPP